MFLTKILIIRTEVDLYDEVFFSFIRLSLPSPQEFLASNRKEEGGTKALGLRYQLFDLI
jgi:hypothetical protein